MKLWHWIAGGATTLVLGLVVTVAFLVGMLFQKQAQPAVIHQPAPQAEKKPARDSEFVTAYKDLLRDMEAMKRVIEDGPEYDAFKKSFQVYSERYRRLPSPGQDGLAKTLETNARAVQGAMRTHEMFLDAMYKDSPHVREDPAVEASARKINQASLYAIRLALAGSNALLTGDRAEFDQLMKSQKGNRP